MPRKTDSHNPAEWILIAFDDPDWPKLRAQVEGVTALLETVKSRLPE